MNSSAEALVDRVRRLLASRDRVREVRMFGGLSFMVDERLAVSARSVGDLLVSVKPEEYEQMIERGAVPAAMRNGREMGRGWLVVPADRLHSDADLEFWVEVGIHSRRACRSPVNPANPAKSRRSVDA